MSEFDELYGVSEDMRSAFASFLADSTERVAFHRTTPVFAVRAAFRSYAREFSLCEGPRGTQVERLLDVAGVPMEFIPARNGHALLNACGLRLKHGPFKAPKGHGE